MKLLVFLLATLASLHAQTGDKIVAAARKQVGVSLFKFFYPEKSFCLIPRRVGAGDDCALADDVGFKVVPMLEIYRIQHGVGPVLLLGETELNGPCVRD